MTDFSCRAENLLLLIALIARLQRKQLHFIAACKVLSAKSLIQTRLVECQAEIHWRQRDLKDIVGHANEKTIGAAIISLDQEKASGSGSYLSQVLSTMNFNHPFSSWISLVYTKINSCVLLNGEECDSFPISQGVSQGVLCL